MVNSKIKRNRGSIGIVEYLAAVVGGLLFELVALSGAI
jgi:hypothetical protein